MISKEVALSMLLNYHELTLERMITGSQVRLRLGNYEYIINADEVKYVGDGSEFVTVALGDNDWTSYGQPTIAGGVLALDGASWLGKGTVELGGKDFQISGRVFESEADMTQRRKIFELYTSAELNMSLYSSGAGKNLDLFANCGGGTIDAYSEPAILEREYSFALKWRQATGVLTLYIDGGQIYSNVIAGFATRQTFNQILLGGSAYHENAAWKGTIVDFRIYDGYAEA